MSETFEGTVVADAVLDPIRGSQFKRVFDRVVDELFKADWAEAKERLGRDPIFDELRRTAAQRRADALVEMATRAEMCRTPDGKRPRPLSRDEPIAFNERSRLYTGKLRRAIQVRDRFCTGEGCDLPADFCDVDHIEPVADGGRTTPTNGRVACNPDNRARPNRRFRQRRGRPQDESAPASDPDP